MNSDNNHNLGMGVRRQAPLARECTYSDFIKYKPLYFKGTEGVVELTQWFKRMETVFRISNCTVKNQIKFATCTLLGSALTWWNSHVRNVGYDVAYAMTWKNLKKRMTDKYYPRGEIKKLEVEMWNLKVKALLLNVKLRTKGNLITTTKLNSNLPRSKCIVKCANCKRVGHLTRDCRSPATTNNKRNPTCYEYGNQWHYRSDCLELKNQNHGNQVGGTRARGMVHALEGGETNQDLNDIEDDINS
uniref:CCHC-type domain-containing protein n=1 Tax=Tanacetum cinerariifolium TaxID=118510 RepID=A0A6L2JPV9_TANCI|nr:hypothetical protein [Tanacetum cinerariifolium]